ncbi:hypothetical protein [Pseudarthrobacter scleromae]|uniref:hypothetical protein n=1 Tax=Pseudarthrobacter scleromae TaxID=158897 RepID=UPI003D00F929
MPEILSRFSFSSTLSLTALTLIGASAAMWLGVGHPLLLLSIGAVVAGVLCVARAPWLAIVAIVGVEAFVLPLMAAGIDRGPITLASFALGIIGAFATLIKGVPQTRIIVWATVAVTVLLLANGIMVGLMSLPFEQLLAGIRIFLTPILAGIIGLGAVDSTRYRVLRFATIVIGFSFFAALYETFIGIDGLISLGLDYGTNVRSYYGELRAPGLFATNYSLGAFAGVMGSLAFVWWPSIEIGINAAKWRIVAIVCGVGCLILSIYRTGVLVLLVSIVLWTLFGRGKGATARKSIATVSGIFVVVYFFQSGLASTASLIARQSVWSSVIENHGFAWFGNGLGFAGSSSISRFSAEEIIVDNYYLNLLLQLGVLAVLLFIPLLVVGAQLTVKSSSISGLQSGYVLVACGVAFVFVDFWEYTSAMSLALFCVGAALKVLSSSAVQPSFASAK